MAHESIDSAEESCKGADMTDSSEDAMSEEELLAHAEQKIELDESMWRSFHLDRTQTVWHNWRITITWRQVDSQMGDGRVFPAGLNLEGKSLPWSGTVESSGKEPLDIDRLMTRTPGPPPEVSSNIFTKRIPWGKVLREHRKQLEQKLEARAEPFRGGRPGSLGEAVASDLQKAASTVDRPGHVRADSATYELVRRLLPEAERRDPRRSNVKMLELLQLEGFPLDASNTSHRTKVREWCRKARAMRGDDR